MEQKYLFEMKNYTKADFYNMSGGARDSHFRDCGEQMENQANSRRKTNF